MAEYSHLHPATRPYADADTNTRIAWLEKPRWIGYPRAQEILGKLEDLLKHPRQPRMPSMLVIGSTNNGKTNLIHNFAQQHPADENPYGEHILAPVLYIQAPPTPSESGIYSEILSTLFERVPSSSDAARRARVIDLLRKIETKVLIIDELHNVLAGSSVKQQHFLNVIKYLSNELQMSIVGCGTGDLLRAVSIDPQIQNRFTPELLPRWQLDTQFRKLLKSFEMTLPLKQASQLHERLLASKIHAMSEGTIGELSALLNTATKFAIRNEQEQIDEEVLNACGYVAPSDRTQLAANL
ncbi:transposase [Marinobacter sp. R17]|uniref:TniB family NTP-binding protein n=1 Tax=Marinobacter sp. R17 TaxID=2484250 RepID=UPI000F4C8BC8|nr:TniB family NTP-binding protein [Marinobacter sp. R17]ROT94732.1 transposase [Marinobacter sp. R17]